MTLKKLEKISDHEYMKTVVSLAVDKRYMKKNGTYNVCIVIYNNKNYYFYQTGMTVTKWNEANDREKAYVQKFWRKSCDLVEDLIDRGAFSFDEFKRMIDAPKVETLNDLMQSRIDSLIENNQLSTAGHYTAALKLYNKVIGETTFNQVTSAKINTFLKYMKENYSDTTALIYLTDVRSIVNEAVSLGYIKEANHPFKTGRYDRNKIEMPKSNSRKDQFLSKDEMMQVFDYYNKTKNEYIGLFLFSYLAGGANLVDVLNLKYNRDYFKNNKEIMTFKRAKTVKKNDFLIKIAVTDTLKSLIPESKEELDSYVFPYLANCKDDAERRSRRHTVSNLVNYHLKKMSKELGFDIEITPTYARHSFATILRRQRVPYEFIENAMGHSLKGVADNYWGEFTNEQLHEFSAYLVA